MHLNRFQAIILTLTFISPLLSLPLNARELSCQSLGLEKCLVEEVLRLGQSGKVSSRTLESAAITLANTNWRREIALLAPTLLLRGAAEVPKGMKIIGQETDLLSRYALFLHLSGKESEAEEIWSVVLSGDDGAKLNASSMSTILRDQVIAGQIELATNNYEAALQKLSENEQLRYRLASNFTISLYRFGYLEEAIVALEDTYIKFRSSLTLEMANSLNDPKLEEDQLATRILNLESLYDFLPRVFLNYSKSQFELDNLDRASYWLRKAEAAAIDRCNNSTKERNEHFSNIFEGYWTTEGKSAARKFYSRIRDMDCGYDEAFMDQQAYKRRQGPRMWIALWDGRISEALDLWSDYAVKPDRRLIDKIEFSSSYAKSMSTEELEDFIQEELSEPKLRLQKGSFVAELLIRAGIVNNAEMQELLSVAGTWYSSTAIVQSMVMSNEIELARIWEDYFLQMSDSKFVRPETSLIIAKAQLRQGQERDAYVLLKRRLNEDNPPLHAGTANDHALLSLQFGFLDLAQSFAEKTEDKGYGVLSDLMVLSIEKNDFESMSSIYESIKYDDAKMDALLNAISFCKTSNSCQ